MIQFVYGGLILLCIALSAYFSASEMSLSSCNRVRLSHMEENGDVRAKRVNRILTRYDDALSAILVGNNLVNIAASSLFSLLTIYTVGEKYTTAATFLLTLIVIILGETIPKITAKKNATRFSLNIAGSIRGLMLLLTPVTYPVVGLTHLLTKGLKGESAEDNDAAVEELHTIIDIAENEKILDEEESDLISAAIDFPDISASDIMTARVDMYSIDADDDFGEIMEEVDASPYSRIPVWEEDIDHVIGVLSVNHFLKALLDKDTVDVRSLILPVPFVYKTMKLPAVLSILRNAQTHIAVVTDEYGGTLGVVTMEDVLEQLVGEIWDETDIVEEDVTRHEDGVYEVDGDMIVEEFMELAGFTEETFDFESETVGGWCIEMLGGFPKEGESFTYRDLMITIAEVDERRVRRILVVRKEEADA